MKRVLPLKAQLFYGDTEVTDANISAPPVVNIVYQPSSGSAVDVSDEALPIGQGSDGNQFVYSGGKWQFNLRVGDELYSAPGTYTITLVSGDAYLIDPLAQSCQAQFIVQ